MKKIKKTIMAFFLLTATCLSVSAQSVLYPQHFDMEDVVLLDGPMRTALITNSELLLRYDADRLMCPFIREAGLSDKKESKYYGWTDRHPSFGNWGQPDWSLEGHVGGHYISALAMSVAACKGDARLSSLVSSLSERLDYCLRIMKDCQDVFDQDTDGMYGFIGGQPITQIWRGLYKNDPSAFYRYGGWVPFYCQHKVLAGLRDAYVYTGSETAKKMFRKMADWSVNVVGNLSTETMQNVLNSEHGGMNEPLADAYHIFGDVRYLEGAKKFSHQTMLNGMMTPSPAFLNNRHANTQVPKYIGFDRIAQVDTGAADYRKSAMNFWADVAENRTVCIGGNSVEEHFLNQENYGRYISQVDGPETCNSNNMMKLSEELFADTHDSKYVDFYENTMYNHILATQDPQTGGYVYFTTLRPQGYKIYSQVNQGMWCCVGTGMENHAKYGHFIYSHNADTLFVNLFTASELKDRRFGIRQETRFPYEQKSTLTITKGGRYVIAVRNPGWTGKSGYTYYDRKWKAGDHIDIQLPMQLRYEECPGLKEYVAFRYGPILLAAKTGAKDLQNEYAGEGRMDHAPGSRGTSKSLITSPLLICERGDVLSLIRKTGEMEFSIDLSNAKGKWTGAKSLTLTPFFATHHDRYIIYWYQQNATDFEHSDLYRQEAEKELLEKRTLDFIGTGEQQSEAGHKLRCSDGSTKGNFRGEFYRDAQRGGYIQYTLTIPEHARTEDFRSVHTSYSIMCRFTTSDRGRKAVISANGKEIGKVSVTGRLANADENGFFNMEFTLTDDIITDGAGKLRPEVEFRIQADESTLCPGLYYVRLLADSSENK